MGITSPCFFIFSILLFSLLQRPTFAIKKSYVVYFGGHSHGLEVSSLDYERVTDSHYDFLGSFLGSKEKAKDAIFYSYTRNINGFAANLEDEEAMEIAKYPEVISVFENKGRKLHTTRSWQFLGLEKDGVIPSESIWKQAQFGKDTIIGNLDTGVWPESESFKDEGIGPIPSKWKGICQNDDAQSVRCNRKLIGMRYFNDGYRAAVGPLNSSFHTARDNDGHGTHTLSTAGGRFVVGANILGNANGTAKGGSPNARVAAYKVCWPPVNDSECFDADIMAGFDAAISDGVDVLSVSLGGTPADFFEDGIAIGSFHAVQKGIIVVASAGNSGPAAGTVSNVAPWIFTVGASTMDRQFPSDVKLGNNKVYKGQSLSSKFLPKKFYPLIKSEDAKAANATVNDAELCQAGSLDPKKVKGKIVVCLRGVNARVQKGETVREAGGIAMILANDAASGNEILADPHVLPATQISAVDGLAVFAYINSTKSPVAYITRPTTDLGTKPAPFMAAFSSQGPSIIYPEILKPDITAPGLSILAAYSPATSPTGLPFDTRRVPYNIISGTSMSCPHVAGIVGLLKTLHPDWSPSAIRSAVMTTSRSRDNVREPMKNSSFIKATPYSYGAGHVRPNRAMDPGLVYDITVDDYLNFLCAIGYNSTQIATFVDKSYSCPSKTLSLTSLNYPSISVPHLTELTTVTRTVKNVGSPGTYKVRFRAPKNVVVSVQPKSLKFEKIGEEKMFKVSLRPKKGGLIDEYSFGRLIWSDGVHYVRSPIVVT
ncbi:subtilisin-like protease SBT5.3 [Tasmannia lanceolata]|uniref:subtilisin-like protease SBT5.3 n=1 Tax=Tasmannia lanceolata TaxID=3420 RepID=UPI004063FAC7